MKQIEELTQLFKIPIQLSGSKQMNTTRLIEPKVDVFNELGFHDISESVKSINTFNATNTPVGAMRIILNPSINAKLPTTILHNRVVNEMLKKITLNSIISVKIDRSSKRHVFLGRVDSIIPLQSYEGRSTKRELEIRCSLMLPKLLLRDDIVNSPVLSTNKKIKDELGDRVQFFHWMRGMKEDGKSVFAGKPEEAVKYILENCVATNSTVISSGAGGLTGKTFFNPQQAETLKFHFLTGEFLYSHFLSAYSGTILNYLNQCIDEHFYEMFFDTETGKDGLAYNTITIRPKPFSYKDYEFIPKAVRNWNYFDDLQNDAIEKTSEDFLLNESLGMSDYELKNFFTVNFINSLIGNSNSILGKYGLQFPILNVDSIKRYGLRALQLTSKLINFDKAKQSYSDKAKEGKFIDIAHLLQSETLPEGGTYLDYLLDKREKAVEWYSFPYFLSGSLTLVGDESLQIGKVLYLKDKIYIHPETKNEHRGVYFYINSANHSWEHGQFFKSRLQVTRGAPQGIPAKWLNENRPKFISTTADDHTEYNIRTREDKLLMDAINKLEKEMNEQINEVIELE